MALAQPHSPGGSQSPLPAPAPPEPPPQPLSPSVPSGQHHRVCPGETEERFRPEHPPKRAPTSTGGHSPLCPGGRPGPSAPAVQARPAPSLPLQGPAAREGTAHTARPAEGTSRSECGFRDWSTAGGEGLAAPAALPISRLSHAMSCMGLSWGGFMDGAGSGVPGGPRRRAHLLSFQPPQAWITLVSWEPLHREAIAEVRLWPPAPGSCTPGLPAPTLSPHTHTAHLHPHSPVCLWVPAGHHPPEREQSQGQGQAPEEAEAASTPWGDAAIPTPSGVQKGGWMLGSLTFSPLMPASLGSPASPCRTPRGYTPSTSAAPGRPGHPSSMGEGGSAPHTHRQPRLQGCRGRLTIEPLSGTPQQRGEDAGIAGQAGVPLRGQGEGTAQGGCRGCPPSG